jgi:N-acetylglucosaminyl-diphospho-decaprenol L-rhamnosyltransferase
MHVMRRNPRPIDVSVVIVSFNTRDLLRTALRTALASQYVDLEVFVVDNGSTDASAEMVESEFPAVHLVRNECNRGFAAANNRAIALAGGRHILLLNPDTEVRPDTVAGMVRFMDQHPQAAICGPRVLFPDGRFQSCGYPFPTLLGEIRQSKNLDKLVRRIVGEKPVTAIGSVPFEVDWVDGCCLMIRSSVVERIGALDEQYFLYAEELDWCVRAGKAGWGVYALPDVLMVHHQGQSSSQLSDFSLMHLVETRLRYYRKHHGLGTALATSLVYVAGCLRQLGRNRQKQAVRLRATVRWWRSLLTA